MTPDDPRHGSVAGHCAHYTDDEPPCFPCRLAKAAYETQRKRLMAYGRWQPWTDAEPARQHVRSLMGQGMTTRQIGTKAGVAYSRITNLIYGRGGQRPVAKMRPEFAATLLAIQPEPARFGVHGVARRLQALVAVGYAGPYLADRLGFSQARVEQFLKNRCITENVMAETHYRVDALYRELSMRPRVGADRYEKQSVARAKHTAAKHGWVSALAWDDDIDDPAATPSTVELGFDVDPVVVDRIIRGDFHLLANHAERLEVLRQWLEAGGSATSLYNRTGWNTTRLTRELNDHQEAS